MHPNFSSIIETLHPLFERLVKMQPLENPSLSGELPEMGIYLFSEGNNHLYVGRSNNLQQRFGQHTRPGSQHNQAVFAFKIAREETGNTKAAYVQGEGSRKALAAEPHFKSIFDKAKKRVRAMDYRCIEVTDQKQQALMEIYCAISLECPYNDFNTH